MLSIRRNMTAAGVGVSLAVLLGFPLAAEEVAKPTDGKTVPAGTEKTPQELLAVGNKAPAFVVGSWVKGEPIDALKPGRVYVVEFWATWCGPCLAGMPHISKLQDEYGEKVRFVGISREEETVVQEFLKKDREEGVTWDQTVTYSLAMDADKRMYDTWFSAAGQSGIPCAFIVAKDGVIEWIGHPARIDEPLAKVVDGTFDRPAAIAAYAEVAKKLKETVATRAVQAAVVAAMKEKDYAKALVHIDEWIEITPDNPLPRMNKLAILSQADQPEKTSAYLADLVKMDWDKGDLLPSIVLGMTAGRYPGTLDDAERLAKRAVEVAGEKNFAARHAMAKVFAERGNYDEAIAWERKALDVGESNIVVLRTLREYESKREAAEKAKAAAEK